MNAIHFLKNEHDKMRKSLQVICAKSLDDSSKKTLFYDLCLELILHEEMEQNLWYPHFKDNKDLEDTVKHLVVEEKAAQKAMKEFERTADDQEWDEKFKKFKRNVEHHANEEEAKLFPNIEKILSKEELDEIGQQMHQYKEDISMLA